MIHRAVILVAFVALACAAAPGAARMPTIAPGVIAGGVYVGDLTSEPARAQLAAQFARPVRVVRGEQHWFATPRRLGADASVDAAVEKALAAQPGAEITVDVRSSEDKMKRFVDTIAHTVDQPAEDAQLVSISSAGPVIKEATTGVAVRTASSSDGSNTRSRTGCTSGSLYRRRRSSPTRTLATFGPLIWISRGSNTLRLYDGVRFVRSFGVATGQSRYPTPSGLWQIVDMQRNPWWRPPDSEWAKD
jgi:hypothetical protein